MNNCPRVTFKNGSVESSSRRLVGGGYRATPLFHQPCVYISTYTRTSDVSTMPAKERPLNFSKGYRLRRIRWWPTRDKIDIKTEAREIKRSLMCDNTERSIYILEITSLRGWKNCDIRGVNINGGLTSYRFDDNRMRSV